jgi:hypothetical protein
MLIVITDISPRYMVYANPPLFVGLYVTGTNWSVKTDQAWAEKVVDKNVNQNTRKVRPVFRVKFEFNN